LRSAYFWIGFHLLIFILILLDLGIFRRKGQKTIRFKQACLHSVFWFGLALFFNLFIYYAFGYESALQFFTGFLIEKSLSVDNLFLFLTIFMHFHVSETDQYKILYWGILGALILRISLILIGVALITKFHWMFYLFGAFLVITGINFVRKNQPKRTDPSKSLGYRILKKIFPIQEGEAKGNFFVKKRGKWKVTTLFVVLLLIEFADILFALDSIPAIFAITTDLFIIYTSNVFAILGLRSLYFVLAASLSRLRYYQWGLAMILVFVGAKMLLTQVITISVPLSLAVIIAILGGTTAFSLLRRSR
jgi:tellurite resistance protein TerC